MDDEYGMPHHQCGRCKKIYHGPHAGKNPGHDVSIIGESGEMRSQTPDEPWDTRNVSHGACPECYPGILAEMRADAERRRAAKAAMTEE